MESTFYENKNVTRILLKPVIIYQGEKNHSMLHLGHLGNLYKSYQLIDKCTNGICIAVIDDINNDSCDRGIIDKFITDIQWLQLKKLQIIKISDTFNYVLSFFWKLVLDKKIFIQIFNTENKNYSFINEPDEVKDTLEKYLNTKPNNFRIKFRLKLPEAKNPLLLQISPEMSHFTLNFALMIIDLMCNVKVLLYENKTNFFSREIKILYEWIFNYYCKKLPQKIENQPYKISNFKYYREEIQELIDNEFFSGWDDPRLLTVSGLRKKGYNPEILKSFCDRANEMAKVNIGMLDLSCKHYLNRNKYNTLIAIIEPVKINITNLRNNQTEFILPHSKSYHADNLIPFSNIIYVERADVSRLREGFDINLKSCCTIKIVEKIYTKTGSLQEINAVYKRETFDKIYNPINSISWLSYEAGEKPVMANFNLYSKWYLNKSVDIKTIELSVYRGIVSKNQISSLNLNDIVLINRVGYFKLDTIEGSISLNLIHSLHKIDKFLHYKNWKK